MMGRTETSGMAFNPSAFRRTFASSLVRPFDGLSGFACPSGGMGSATADAMSGHANPICLPLQIQ